MCLFQKNKLLYIKIYNPKRRYWKRFNLYKIYYFYLKYYWRIFEGIKSLPFREARLPGFLFFWTQPKKQFFFNLFWMDIRKHSSYSSYSLIKKYLTRPRCFRRNLQNAPALTIVFWYLYKFTFQRPMLVYLKNFSWSSLTLLKVFYQNLVSTKVQLLLGKAYNIKKIKRRRIKRRVYENILRQNLYKK